MTARLETLIRPLVQERTKLFALPDGRVVGGDEVTVLADRVEEALAEAGVEPAARVLVLAESRWEVLAALLGIWQHRTTASLVDDTFDPSALAGILSRLDPRAILVTDRCRRLLRFDLVEGMAVLRLDHDLAPSPGFDPDVDPFLGQADDTSEDDALVLFTSGTTGRQRGVLLTHENLGAGDLAGRAHGDVVPNPRLAGRATVLSMPHGHSFWWNTVVLGLVNEMVLVPVPPGDLDSFDEALAQADPVHIPVVPLVARELLRRLERSMDDSSLLPRLAFGLSMTLSRLVPVPALLLILRPLLRPVRRAALQADPLVIGYGGAPLSARDRRRLQAFGMAVVAGYGATESASRGTLTDTSNLFRPVDSTTVGAPLPDTEVRILEPDADGVGEVALRSPHIMRGYLGEPEDTASVKVAGWLHTGDLGWIDRRGELHLCGRIKEWIVLPSGEKVTPPEVEARYCDIDGVAELAAFGAPLGDEASAQEVAVAVVVAPGTDPEMVRRRLQARAASLPAQLQVARIRFVDTLPRTALGKVRRRELGERVA